MALGVDPDELEVALAVRMSMSVPLVFEPVRFRNPETKETHLMVDGGLLSNFPVWLFDPGNAMPVCPTFGLLLVEKDNAPQTVSESAGLEQALTSIADHIATVH